MELKNWLNSINLTKEDLSENISSYPPYIINRCLSGHIVYSNGLLTRVNLPGVDSFLQKDMQYSFI